MSQVPGLDTSDMVSVHRAFREAFAAAPTLAGSASEDAGGRVELVGNFYANVLEFLRVHHEGEELLLFPLLRERCPTEVATVDRIGAQHHEVDGAVAMAQELLGRWPTEPGPEVGRRLAESLVSLGIQLTAHLDDEERELLPLCAGNLSEQEWGALPEHAMRAFAGDKVWLILGLIFEQMDGGQRAHVLAHMPPPALRMWTTMGERAAAQLITEVRSPLR
ncbi:MAG TPA: hemerythrin domain-containing protein [Acidimicrobiales bacterium]|nr:hemerythrin domain-containing protein [Acidimicrobiales bacterium]